MIRSELKANAKASLKGNYGDAITILVVFELISFAFGFVAGLLGGILNISENILDLINILGSLAISGLFGFGLSSYYLKLSRNEEVSWKELFNKTDMAIPYILITILTGIFTFLWSLLFIIPGIIAAISYSLVHYIKLDNPELSELEVIKKSKQMMQGHKMEYVLLSLSFIGWAILGIFTFGILYVWLIPYINVTMANFYNKIKQEITI